MSERKVGAAVVIDPDGHGPGIITERDILHSVGAGHDPDGERVGEHLTREVVFAAPDWSLEEAAAVMVRGGFRHLIVIEDGEGGGRPLRARHRALLDGRRRGLSRAGERRRGMTRMRSRCERARADGRAQRSVAAPLGL